MDRSDPIAPAFNLMARTQRTGPQSVGGRGEGSPQKTKRTQKGERGWRRLGSLPALPVFLRLFVFFEAIPEGGNGVRSVRLTFERVASPRSCGSRAPPLPQELQGYLLNHRWNRRVEIGSSSRRDAAIRTLRFAALLGSRTSCQMDRSAPIAPLQSRGPRPGGPSDDSPARKRWVPSSMNTQPREGRQNPCP
jgi:hypothetical protein